MNYTDASIKEFINELAAYHGAEVNSPPNPKHPNAADSEEYMPRLVAALIYSMRKEGAIESIVTDFKQKIEYATDPHTMQPIIDQGEYCMALLRNPGLDVTNAPAYRPSPAVERMATVRTVYEEVETMPMSEAMAFQPKNTTTQGSALTPTPAVAVAAAAPSISAQYFGGGAMKPTLKPTPPEPKALLTIAESIKRVRAIYAPEIIIEPTLEDQVVMPIYAKPKP